MSDPQQWPITGRQKDALDFIRKFQAEHDGMSPSIREIGAGIGAKGIGPVCVFLSGLKERGWVDWLPNKTRTIRIIDPQQERKKS